MKFLLDTTPCVAFLRGQNALLLQRFQQHSAGDIALCTIVLTELYYGADKSNNPARQRTAVDAFAGPYTCLSFDQRAADLYGGIRVDLESRGLPIGAHDYLIAAIALANNLTLVTHNTNEFSRVNGLNIEDWEVP
jgi:tRNA(fMet)-specific endonuclease VapC